ncbi:hypothetical protein BXP70_23725 [Hymenobacter crusticola]|uniref:Uncharacterized protein n=1 Tax=Hymenobacter crusticola TaxID=1770526 RepID=A0A243W787_9BACT|nr:hypothetical protein BXP70_23725 [Hymenobacter crusticola]
MGSNETRTEAGNISKCAPHRLPPQARLPVRRRRFLTGSAGPGCSPASGHLASAASWQASVGDNQPAA